ISRSFHYPFFLRFFFCDDAPRCAVDFSTLTHLFALAGNTYVCSLLVALAMLLVAVQCGDIMRKSIVFDKNTPDVFYCPQHKPIGFEKMLVKARPLSRLCQFEGRQIPEDYKSDCYNDVDETEYACKEKYRIMVSVEIYF
ncbi:PREDICTED: uncharacterized protein LOC105568930, partial [Vollenhovia emeryi]|uniref:uncharacterized protein LOC105568930 n=1 Tax=Vollenhovia emeryi TaxID=411798 RepID=UPI0005F54EBF